tara:strand:- start:614 stop:823 length:210 start_codon:yes stop_codon:yes gene_type:complete
MNKKNTLFYGKLVQNYIDRKKRADIIREIRRLVRKLIGQHERDTNIADYRKKNIKVVVNNENHKDSNFV